MKNVQASPVQSVAPTKGREIVASLRGVSRHFDNPGFVRALAGASFEVRRGEVFGLLGPAGSGKSTALRILAGRLAPSEGKAKVLGRSPRRRRTKERVGYLPQVPSHSRSRFVAELISFLSDLFGLAKVFPERKDAHPYSEQERRRALRQILVRNPELVLLDAPLAGLDMAGCREIAELIRGLTQRGKTVILSSDSLADTKEICHRMAVFYGGQIEAIGTLEELLAKPASLRCLGPLLPAPTVERALAVIREGLSGPSPAGAAQTGNNQDDLNSAGEKYAAGLGELAAADAVLERLSKASRSMAGQQEEPYPAVNHALLAALAKMSPKS